MANEEIEIRFNVKLTGTATVNLQTGEVDWGTTRVRGGITPTWKKSGIPVLPEKIKEKSPRKGDDFIDQVGAQFQRYTGRIPPTSKSSKDFIHQWRVPILNVLRQIWATAGYDPDSRKASFVNYKYGNVALGAMKRVMADAIAHMKSSNLDIYSPASIEKVAATRAASTDYIKLTYEENKRKGRVLELPE